MTMYNNMEKQNKNFTMNSVIDEEDNLFDHFIKVEEIEESDESNTMLHSIIVKDEIIDDIEYESKHLLVQTLFHQDHSVSQQNENNNLTSIRLSECLKEEVEENEDIDYEQDYLERYLKKEGNEDIDYEEDNFVEIVKDEFCEQNKFRLNGFTIKSQLLREQKGLCINMKDKKLTTINLKTSKISSTTSYLVPKSTAYSVCEKTFSNKMQSSQHVLVDTVKNPFVCDVCQVRFPKKCQLKIHVLTHSWQKPYRCNMCNQSFKSLNAANKHHAIVHTEGKPFKCKICQTSFGTVLNLKHHMSVHFDEDFTCKICNLHFICKSHLDRHISIIHSNNLSQYKCNICNKLFLTKRDLFDHKKIHSKKSLFKCPICYKYLKFKSLLISHMNSHSSQKPYACLFCNKTYKLRSFMVRHAKTHQKSY